LNESKIVACITMTTETGKKQGLGACLFERINIVLRMKVKISCPSQQVRFMKQ